MSIREYIGARYVPIFGRKDEESIAWDNTKPYEPLTIVLYQGNSYTSRQYVPIGIDITNNLYWAQTGNYNAQVEQYRQEVFAYNDRITANANAISDEILARENADDEIDAKFGNDITTTNTVSAAIAAEETARENADADIDAKFGNDITTTNTVSAAISAEETARENADLALDLRINTVESELSDLVSGFNIYRYFYGYNMVVIGDSYAYGTGASDHLSGDTKRFSSILASSLGATEFNYALGATGFCDDGGVNGQFSNQVANAINGMSVEEKNNTHLVLIAGGINDYREGATFSATQMQAGARTACERAAEGFPNAIILVVPMLFNGHDANPRLLNFENAIVRGAGNSQHSKRTVYIQGAWTWCFGMSNCYASDQLHPNDTGHLIFAGNIYSHILGGVDYYNALCSITWESGYGATVDTGGYLQFHNGMVQSYGFRMTSFAAVSADSVTRIGTVSNQCTPIGAVCTPAMVGNKQVGLWSITTSGALWLHATTNISSGANVFCGPFSYLPKGTI